MAWIGGQFVLCDSNYFARSRAAAEYETSLGLRERISNNLGSILGFHSRKVPYRLDFQVVCLACLSGSIAVPQLVRELFKIWRNFNLRFTPATLNVFGEDWLSPVI